MAGKVFSSRGHAVFLKTSDQRRAENSRESLILAERAYANDWVCRIVVDVENRSERDVNAERAAL